MKLLQWLINDFKRNVIHNKKGLAPWIIPSLILGGGAGLNMLGKSKQEDPEMQWLVDPWIQKLRDIQEPKLSESYYNVPQTGVESATESSLLSRLGRGVGDIKPSLGPEAAAPYYEAAKARMGERFGEEQAFAKDIYNREGVLTSTPGVQGQIDLKRKQGQELDEFSQKLMYEDIARDLQATTMAEDIIYNTLNQGMSLGQQQHQNLQWPYTMAQGAMGQAQGMGSMGYISEPETNWMQDLGGAGMDFGKMMLMMNMLKGVPAAGAETPTTT